MALCRALAREDDGPACGATGHSNDSLEGDELDRGTSTIVPECLLDRPRYSPRQTPGCLQQDVSAVEADNPFPRSGRGLRGRIPGGARHRPAAGARRQVLDRQGTRSLGRSRRSRPTAFSRGRRDAGPYGRSRHQTHSEGSTGRSRDSVLGPSGWHSGSNQRALAVSPRREPEECPCRVGLPS